MPQSRVGTETFHEGQVCVCVCVCVWGCGPSWHAADRGARPWLTLKASGCIPELWSRFMRTSRTSMLVGSVGSATSLFSGRIRSRRAGSRRRALSSMEEMELPERSILFSFAKRCRAEHRDTPSPLAPAAAAHALLLSQHRGGGPVLCLHQGQIRRKNLINLGKSSDSVIPFPGVFCPVWMGLEEGFEGKTQQVQEFLDPSYFYL